MRVIREILRNLKQYQSRSVPICIFCYHKVGTVLLSKIFKHIGEQKHWKVSGLLGKQTRLPRKPGIVIFGHSLVDPADFTIPFLGAHFIRDPREIIVSGYLYHRRTSEKWCISQNFRTKSLIVFPWVPYSQEHRSEEWKRSYLKSLGGKSYQENLLRMEQREGLLFEMNNYGAWTIEGMREWNYHQDNILEIKFEDLMNNYDDTFRLIFGHLGFSAQDTKLGLAIAAEHDLGRKSVGDVARMAHVSANKSSKWRDYFEEMHRDAFIDKFGDVLVELGYEKDNNWQIN